MNYDKEIKQFVDNYPGVSLERTIDHLYLVYKCQLGEAASHISGAVHRKVVKEQTLTGQLHAHGAFVESAKEIHHYLWPIK